MPYRLTKFTKSGLYHIYNRRLQKQPIFTDRKDYSHFLQTFFYYQIENPKPKFSTYRISKLFKIDPSKKIVDIICYCLMPNHFHLLVTQLRDGGVSEFMRRFIHSYTKYRNIKYNLQGPIFQGIFKAVEIETDEQLLHLSRYIHLNPVVSCLINNPDLYPWSSYNSYFIEGGPFINKGKILEHFKSLDSYRDFVLNQKEYGKTLEILKHITLDKD
ncbi:hypothetical protein A3H85_01720 [Candidatus Daviesbacteria bacterium RIFCSPLOWO2_02_FULL_40_8]|nr:MAG: hypothetical protein A3H85_01720 [Candidatus Daviesbacteria bacterium RIFCSPLOWO2_02_FULL_40_8]